jgi:hypothetical protein
LATECSAPPHHSAYSEEADTSHFSDESSSDRYSYDDEEEEEARERDVNRILFSEMPQPKMTDDKRTLEDEYACGLQENIKQLQGHILDIQKREVEKMSAYGNSLAPNADPKKEEGEVRGLSHTVPSVSALVTDLTINQCTHNRGRSSSSRCRTSARRERGTERCSTTPFKKETTSSRADRSQRSRRGSPRIGYLLTLQPPHHYAAPLV